MTASHKYSILLSAVALGLTLPTAWTQAPQTLPKAAIVKAPEFDVATIKKTSYHNGMRIGVTNDGFSGDNVTLKSLIGNAYPINQELIFGGPSWADSMGFDVNAKVVGMDAETLKNMPWTERQAMMQSLLADRFKLKVHLETKELPVYDLLVAKGGFKLKPLPPLDAAAEEAKVPDQRRQIGTARMGSGTYSGQGITMDGLRAQLEYIVHHTISDKTNVSGIYDIDLKWTPEENSRAGDSGAEVGPSIFTALQEQLGLRLQSAKGPVKTLVIDHAELPTEN